MGEIKLDGEGKLKIEGVKKPINRGVVVNGKIPPLVKKKMMRLFLAGKSEEAVFKEVAEYCSVTVDTVKKWKYDNVDGIRGDIRGWMQERITDVAYEQVEKVMKGKNVKIKADLAKWAVDKNWSGMSGGGGGGISINFIMPEREDEGEKKKDRMILEGI